MGVRDFGWTRILRGTSSWMTKGQCLHQSLRSQSRLCPSLLWNIQSSLSFFPMNQCCGSSRINRLPVKKPSRDTVSIYDLTAWYLVNYLLSIEHSLDFPLMHLLKAKLLQHLSHQKYINFYANKRVLIIEHNNSNENKAAKIHDTLQQSRVLQCRDHLKWLLVCLLTLHISCHWLLLIESIIHLSIKKPKRELWDRSHYTKV